MGSSIGIALITTELAHREAVHRSVLVERINRGNFAATHRLQLLAEAFGRFSADPVANAKRALAVTDGIINGQSMLLSFADVFQYVAAAFVVTLPLLLMLGRGKTTGPAAAAAH
jgi:DHA2 family multidrug resistance protein